MMEKATTKTAKKAAKRPGRQAAPKEPVRESLRKEPQGRGATNAAGASPEAAAVVPNIDYSLCQGCAGCAEAFPHLFEMRGERAWVIGAERYDPVRDAGVTTICPYYAISIEKV